MGIDFAGSGQPGPCRQRIGYRLGYRPGLAGFAALGRRFGGRVFFGQHPTVAMERHPCPAIWRPGRGGCAGRRLVARAHGCADGAGTNAQRPGPGRPQCQPRGRWRGIVTARWRTSPDAARSWHSTGSLPERGAGLTRRHRCAAVDGGFVAQRSSALGGPAATGHAGDRAGAAHALRRGHCGQWRGGLAEFGGSTYRHGRELSPIGDAVARHRVARSTLCARRRKRRQQCARLFRTRFGAGDRPTVRRAAGERPTQHRPHAGPGAAIGDPAGAVLARANRDGQHAHFGGPAAGRRGPAGAAGADSDLCQRGHG